MKCLECGGEIKEVTGDYIWQDKFLGHLSLSNLKYKKCKKCGDVIFPSESSHRIDLEEKRFVNDWLLSLPLKDFCKSKYVTNLLGFSRQAFHKHPRYKGRIYRVEYEGEIHYLKKSVELFKKSGDGRFEIQQHHKDKLSHPHKESVAHAPYSRWDYDGTSTSYCNKENKHINYLMTSENNGPEKESISSVPN